jgi:hypothetical protein
MYISNLFNTLIMDMLHGRDHEHPAWTCSIGMVMQYSGAGHTTCKCSIGMGMSQGHAAWARVTDMKHGQAA